ncbi:hypothetical protein BHE74_00024922 [Ensete ventricosum]|nr:hypothetical protein BHE74_00024922 [Ensete ventricosum]RZS02139.1 hypothetical protein BHM03_00032119 [Ensete ventricosum]
MDMLSEPSPGTGVTYRSNRIAVYRPPATGGYCRNRLSTVDFGRRQLISIVDGRLREKEEEGEEEKGEKREIPDLPRFLTRSVARGRFFASGRFFVG